MSQIDLTNNADGGWPDLTDHEDMVIDVTDQTLFMSYLEGGMQDGSPSMALKIILPDGHIVFWQCPMDLWLTTNEDLRNKFRR